MIALICRMHQDGNLPSIHGNGELASKLTAHLPSQRLLSEESSASSIMIRLAHPQRRCCRAAGRKPAMSSLQSTHQSPGPGPGHGHASPASMRRNSLQSAASLFPLSSSVASQPVSQRSIDGKFVLDQSLKSHWHRQLRVLPPELATKNIYQ